MLVTFVGGVEEEECTWIRSVARELTPFVGL